MRFFQDCRKRRLGRAPANHKKKGRSTRKRPTKCKLPEVVEEGHLLRYMVLSRAPMALKPSLSCWPLEASMK